MSSGSWKQTDVGCPFYRNDDGKHRITCEGILENSTISQNMSREDYKMYIREYCSKRYICCEIYRMLMDKYEEE